MIFEASEKNIKVQFIIEPLLIGFEGKYLIEKKEDVYTQTYNCKPVVNNDEWDLIKSLLFETSKKLAEISNASMDIPKTLWKKFFYSKQLEFNFGA